ncbi:MAG: hypothetical protein R3F14_45425, partial [Polyangiaceae bacterium]
LAGDRVVAAGQGAAGVFTGFDRFTSEGDFPGEPCVPNDLVTDSVDGVLAYLDTGTGACGPAARLSGNLPFEQPTERVRSVAAMSTGELWVTGTFEKVLLLNGDPLSPPLDGTTPIESFLLKIAKDGLEQQPADVPFVQGWSGDANQVVQHLAVLTDGRVAVTGSYTGSIPGGAPELPLSANAPQDFFLLVIDPEGTTVQF